MDDSDEALFRAYAGGDEAAFVRLLERYRNRVAHLVRCRLGPRSLWVEDVAQDVFVQVHRGARRFEGRSSFKTWLYAIALRVCRDHRRRQRTAADRSAIEFEEGPGLAALPDLSLDPLQSLVRGERSALVRAAVERLGPAHRTVLQLRDGEDMSYEEIARLLAVPVGTVRSRLHNARAALARELARCLTR
ncbi:MAG TPA: sigma-70 family RNA polymerase sigma factor [Patescibacteria group bacterium]|nr:sigma-70 family RNA polymerase sigma factor [Patescibacteria group bacterium]